MKLNRGIIRKIVMELNKGKAARKLAADFGITKRRINQVYAEYLKTGLVPLFGEGVGRPVKPIEDWEVELVRKAHSIQRVGARRLEPTIRQDYHQNISHNRIHAILLREHLAKPNPKKQKRRKYLSYEREHSLSAVHLDWHTNKHEKHVLAVIDDSSRKIIAGGEFAAESAEITVAVAEQALSSVAGYASIREFITDNGSVFTCNQEGVRESSEFEKFLAGRGIKHIRIRPHHPQSNGKIERWFGTYESHREEFASFDEFVEWYNCVRYHESLDCRAGLRTPSEVFVRRLAPEHVFGLTKSLFNW